MKIIELLKTLDTNGIKITSEFLVNEDLERLGFTPETEIISTKQLTYLENSAFKLECLIEQGVDNWDGYSEAMHEYYKTVENE